MDKKNKCPSCIDIQTKLDVAIEALKNIVINHPDHIKCESPLDCADLSVLISKEALDKLTKEKK